MQILHTIVFTMSVQLLVEFSFWTFKFVVGVILNVGESPRSGLCDA